MAEKGTIQHFAGIHFQRYKLKQHEMKNPAYWYNVPPDPGIEIYVHVEQHNFKNSGP